ncbi:MAG: hypothetical protein HOO96_00195 [Polyangiaceae bacterium]|nr:hypothetical protein [Polyangiaceae bacterium]
MRFSALALFLGSFGLFVACGTDPGPAPADGRDASVLPRTDGAVSTDDGGSSDAALAKDAGDILGTLSGMCGVLAPELTKPTPSLFDNTVAFVAGESYVRDSLSEGGKVLYDTPNAGGSSTESEVMSYEVLRYCDGAKLLKTETQIQYAAPGDAGGNPITDILMEIDGKKIGVSVTRAYKPASLGYTDADAQTLLMKKLGDINLSSKRVLPVDKWSKQILHVFTATQAQTDAVHRVWATLDAATKADTIVVVTRTTGGGFIYCNPDPPLGTECN